MVSLTLLWAAPGWKGEKEKTRKSSTTWASIQQEGLEVLRAWRAKGNQKIFSVFISLIIERDAFSHVNEGARAE